MGALAVAAACGCNSPYMRWPDLYHPGTAQQQRAEAVVHDPYPLDDVGPPVVGGRPLGYLNPVPEVERSRMYDNARGIAAPRVVPFTNTQIVPSAPPPVFSQSAPVYSQNLPGAPPPIVNAPASAPPVTYDPYATSPPAAVPYTPPQPVPAPFSTPQPVPAYPYSAAPPAAAPYGVPTPAPAPYAVPATTPAPYAVGPPTPPPYSAAPYSSAPPAQPAAPYQYTPATPLEAFPSRSPY